MTILTNVTLTSLRQCRTFNFPGCKLVCSCQTSLSIDLTLSDVSAELYDNRDIRHCVL